MTSDVREYELAMQRLRVFYEDFAPGANYAQLMAIYLLFLLSYNRFA